MIVLLWLCPHEKKSSNKPFKFLRFILINWVVHVPGIHPLHSDWSAGRQWSLQEVASYQECCYSRDVLLSPPPPLSMVTHPCLIPWKKNTFWGWTQCGLWVCLCCDTHYRIAGRDFESYSSLPTTEGSEYSWFVAGLNRLSAKPIL